MTNICTPDQTYIDYKVTENFWFSELIQSDTALKLGIDNTPTKDLKINLENSCKYLFQPTRDILGKPVLASSVFRCDKLNAAIGGASRNGKQTSAHCYGYAMDFKCPSFGDSFKIASYLVEQYEIKKIKFDQIICEYPGTPGSWVHIAWKSPSGAQRGQILTAKKIKGKTQYLSGLHK